MSARLQLQFAPGISAEERAAVADALEAGLGDAQRFAGYRRRVKDVYRVETPAGPLLVKRRRHTGWLQRLGRTVRPTKADREFRNLLALSARGVRCPDAVAVGRLGRLLVRESLIVEAFVADAVPLSAALAEATVPRDALLDALFDLFRLLDAKGVVHRDLHWDNVLVRSSPEGPELWLIDALHVRFVSPPAGETLAGSVEWFLVFLLHAGAAAEIVSGFLDRLPGLGLESLSDGRAVLARAERLAKQL